MQSSQTNTGNDPLATISEQSSSLSYRLLFPSDHSSTTMRPEALDAFATHSLRPAALEAASSDQKTADKSEILNMDEDEKDEKK